MTQEVYHQVRKFKYLHWFAIKGISGDRPLVSRPSYQEINYRGEYIKRGIQLYKVGVDRAKETLYARSHIESPGAKYLNFPNDLDSNWFEGFCSEVQVTQHKNGRPHVVWEKLAGVRNEPLDTSVYALAAANLVGVQRIRWASEEKKLQSQNISSEEDKDAISPEARHCVIAPSKKVRRSSRRRRGSSLLDSY